MTTYSYRSSWFGPGQLVAADATAGYGPPRSKARVYYDCVWYSSLCQYRTMLQALVNQGTRPVAEAGRSRGWRRRWTATATIEGGRLKAGIQALVVLPSKMVPSRRLLEAKEPVAAANKIPRGPDLLISGGAAQGFLPDGVWTT